MTTDYIISEMADEERDRLAARNRSLRNYPALWKLCLHGHWHYGFLSREQAEWAVQPKSY